VPLKQRVVDHIVGHLAAIGVDYIFGVDGANIEDLYDAAFFQSDITAVLAKHEFSAATMADGYSRSGGGLGVVAANSGVSALNLVAGLGNRLPAACRYWRWWANRRPRWMVAAAYRTPAVATVP
jgi:acetolactate synthase I/II/III large subunit